MELNKIYNQDCLVGMKEIPDKSIDCIICDLPYGMTACKWDCVLPFDAIWEQYKRVIKQTGAIVLFSQQPFTSALMMSNMQMWRYNWIWQKESGTNFLNSHHQPLKVTEDICVFGLSLSVDNKKGMFMTYHPQMRKGFAAYSCKNGKFKSDTALVHPNSDVRRGGVADSKQR